MVLLEAFLGDSTRSVPTGSPPGSSRAPTHDSTDVRIVLELAGGGVAKIYGGAEVAGCCLAEYEHRSAVLRGPDEALTAPTVSRERRDRRKKKLAKEEAEQVETREAQAAQATTRAASHVHNDEDEEAEAVNTACAVPIEEDDRDQQDEIGESTTDRTEDEVTRRQEGGEQTVPGAETTRAGVDGSELDGMPETVAVECEQVELPDYKEGVGENDELISLVQQPAELEEAAGDARVVKSREEDQDISGRVVEKAHHSFCFSPPKRDRKLSDEEQQDEAKRPKSPEREGVQLAEQHDSGGECGEQMREILRMNPVGGFGSVGGFGFGSGPTKPYSYPGLGSARRGSARRQQHFK